MLYEIISPDAFLRPFINDYTTLSSIYAVVRNAYAKKVYVDKAFEKKTSELAQKHIGADGLESVTEFVAIDAETIELIKKQKRGDGTKVINLVKSLPSAKRHTQQYVLLYDLPSRRVFCPRDSTTT